MTTNVIIDIGKNADNNFDSLLRAVSDTLNSVITTFVKYFRLKNTDGFMQLIKYDYDSLETTIIYNLLNLLGITYAENIPQSRAVENMTDYSVLYPPEDMNRKRVKRIKNVYNERNLNHSIYLNSTPFTPKILASDALWYELLSDFPILKRFLFNEEAIITKKFFDDLNSVYEKINSYKGYDKFYLMHKLEMSSKLELFYRILSSIKREKRRLKLVNSEVEVMIDRMYHLHIVPYNHPEFFCIVRKSISMGLFDEILNIPYDKNTVNTIVFSVDKLADYYIESPTNAINFIRVLNFIHNTVVFHLCCKIENELSSSDSQKNFDLITNIQHCKRATYYFDSYMNLENLINMHKNCSKDITFTHFKRIYMIKTEPKKK